MPATNAPPAEVRWWTFALTVPSLVLDALPALQPYRRFPSVVEALCDLAEAPPGDLPGVLALRALKPRQEPMVRDALWSALDSPQGPLRLAAVRLLHTEAEATEDVLRLLRSDPAPMVRRECVRALWQRPAATRLGLVEALTDPAWRVRRDAVHYLTRWLREDPSVRALWRERLGPRVSHPMVAGALHLIDACTGGEPDEPPEVPRTLDPAWDADPAVMREQLLHMGVEERARQARGFAALFQFDDGQPVYAYLQDVRRVALSTLCQLEDPQPLAELVRALQEPRHPTLLEWVTELDTALPPPRRARLVDVFLARPEEPPAALCWALSRLAPGAAASGPQVHAVARLATHPEPTVRAAALRAGRDPGAVGRALGGLEDGVEAVRIAALDTLARQASAPECDAVDERLGALAAPGVAWRRAVARWVAHSQVGWKDAWAGSLAVDPDAQVRAHIAGRLARRAPEDPALLARLAGDGDRRVREAALTPERAEALWRAPQEESSWRVLGRAARLLDRSLEELTPRPPTFTPPPRAVHRSTPFASYFPVSIPDTPAPRMPPARQAPPRVEGRGPAAPRALTPQGPWVAPLGISGRYLPPESCFAEAVEAGVNLLFWEPPYQTLTSFFRHSPSSLRQRLVTLGGSFSADPRTLRAEAEQMLRVLRVERLGLFLLFWARSPTRMADPVLEVLAALREEGKIQEFGLSTHDRSLAVHALRQGWGTVMVRHSAVHRGAEQEVLPLAERLGRPAVLFSSLCYGKLLDPPRWLPHPAKTPLPTAADCYRFSLSRPGVGLVVSAPRTQAQVREGLQALVDPTLPAEREATLLAHGARVYRESRNFARWVRHR